RSRIACHKHIFNSHLFWLVGSHYFGQLGKNLPQPLRKIIPFGGNGPVGHMHRFLPCMINNAVAGKSRAWVYAQNTPLNWCVGHHVLLITCCLFLFFACVGEYTPERGHSNSKPPINSHRAHNLLALAPPSHIAKDTPWALIHSVLLASATPACVCCKPCQWIFFATRACI